MAEEEINFDSEKEVAKEADKNSKREELSLDDLKSKWLPHPKVGEELVVDVVKAFKDRNINAKDKSGQAFKTNLSGVDYKITIETKDGKLYRP